MSQESSGAELLSTIQRLRALDRKIAVQQGLSIEEMHCLLQIHLAAPESIKDLRLLLNLKPPHVSKLLRCLEDRQYVIREADLKDQRKGRVRLTPGGRQKAADITRMLAQTAGADPPQPVQPPPADLPLERETATPPPPPPWHPRIIAFFCTWCTYTAADLAGVSRLRYDPEVRVIRLMCSGRVDPQFILEAFRQGADGVLIGGCHPGDCHYLEGNIKALRRIRLLERVLRAAGVEPRRLRLEWISAAEGEKVQRVIREMTAVIRELGPMNGRTAGHACRRDAEETVHV
jgi:F420-non-reducing hydrogenase iron-sulfur subunit